MSRILYLFLIFLTVQINLYSQTQTHAEYVNSLIGAGVNGQGIMSFGGTTHLWADSDYEDIAAAGFNSVRIVYEPGQTLYAISSTALATIKTCVDKCIANGLFPVIDYHITPNWFIYNYTTAQGNLFVSNLGAIASHFSAYTYDQLVIELVNEPNTISASVWNDLLARAVAEIRSKDADRVIMVSPLVYAHMEGLDDLTLPDDDDLILSIHYYAPTWMYYQGVPWENSVYYGLPYSNTQWRHISPLIDNLEVEYQPLFDFQAANNNIPVNIGEFGTWVFADSMTRASYLTMLARWYEYNDFSHMVWEYDQWFGIRKNQALTGSETGVTSDDWYYGIKEALVSDPLIMYAYSSETILVSDFSSTTGWSTYSQYGGVLNIAAVNNELKINVTSAGTNWVLSARVYTPTFAMTKDSIYRVSYTIRTETGTKPALAAKIDSTWGYYTYNLGTQAETVVQTFIRAAATNSSARWEILVGGSTGSLFLENFMIEKITAHTYLDTEQPYYTEETETIVVQDTIFFKDYSSGVNIGTVYNADCADSAIVRALSGGTTEGVTDTIGYLNFRYYNEAVSGWVGLNGAGGSFPDSVELATDIWFVNTPKLNATNTDMGQGVWPTYINYFAHYISSTDETSKDYIIRGSGLTEAGYTYKIGVISSHNSSTTRYLVMDIGGEKDSVNASYNDGTYTANIDGITATDSRIDMSFTKTTGQTGYLNALFLIRTAVATAENTDPSYVRFNSINFGTGVDSLQYKVDFNQAVEEKSFELRLSSVDGPLIDSFNVDAAGCAIRNVALPYELSGIQVLYAVLDTLDEYSWMLFSTDTGEEAGLVISDTLFLQYADTTFYAPAVYSEACGGIVRTIYDFAAFRDVTYDITVNRVDIKLSSNNVTGNVVSIAEGIGSVAFASYDDPIGQEEVTIAAISSDDPVCIGDAITLTATGTGFNSYMWYTTGTGVWSDREEYTTTYTYSAADQDSTSLDFWVAGYDPGCNIITLYFDDRKSSGLKDIAVYGNPIYPPNVEWIYFYYAPPIKYIIPFYGIKDGLGNKWNLSD